VLLPTPFWLTIRSLKAEALKKFLDVARARLLNPVSKIHLFHIFAEGSQRDATLLEEAGRERDEILSTDSGRENWKTFAQLLDWTHRTLLWRADSRNLDVAVRLTITWLHAGRLYNALLGHRVEQPKLRAAYRNVAESAGPDLVAYDKVSWFDAAHPRNVTRLPFLLRGLGNVLATLPPDVAAQFRLTNVPWESPSASAALLLRETSLAGNALNSWLGGDARAPLGAIMSDEALAQAQPFPSGDVIEQAIRELQSGPEVVSRWNVIQLLLGDLPVPEPSASILNDVISKTDFTKLLTDNSARDHMALLFACGRVAAGVRAETREHLENNVFKLIKHYRDSESPELDLRTRAGVAIGCLVQLAMNEADERDLFRRYHELLTKAVWAWPEIANLVGDRFCGWPPVRPLARERGMWVLNLTVRGLIHETNL
jgi:hypothetical protein